MLVHLFTSLFRVALRRLTKNSILIDIASNEINLNPKNQVSRLRNRAHSRVIAPLSYKHDKQGNQFIVRFFFVGSHFIGQYLTPDRG